MRIEGGSIRHAIFRKSGEGLPPEDGLETWPRPECLRSGPLQARGWKTCTSTIFHITTRNVDGIRSWNEPLLRRILRSALTNASDASKTREAADPVPQASSHLLPPPQPALTNDLQSVGVTSRKRKRPHAEDLPRRAPNGPWR